MAKNSKWVLLLAAQIFWSCVTESAFGIVLAWDPSPDANVTGYAIYYGTNRGSYQTRLDVGRQTSATIQLPASGATYFFAATAYTIEGVESLPSNEVSYVSPGALLISETTNGLNRQLRFSVGPDQHWELQASEDFLQWDTLCALDAVTNGWIDVFDPVNPFGPLRFYRLVSASSLARVPNTESKQVSYDSPGALLISRTANPLNMQLRFSVGPNRHWQLQASEDFLHWTLLCELTALANGWIDVFDPVIPSRPARFYRLANAATSPPTAEQRHQDDF